MRAPAPILDAGLFAPGERVAAAVSGGSDSVALLRSLLDRRRELGVGLSVAHVHHGIRGAAADRDAAFVEDLAREHGLSLHLHRCDAPREAAAGRENLEEAARNLRYSFFRRLMEEGSVSVVATAHTLDDQAETVLHRFLRGAWTSGLAGIHAVVREGKGRVVRPFLECRRADLQAWLREAGQSWREDESNDDPAFTRNRIRHQILPLLAGINPQISRQLARVASIAVDEEAYWEGQLRHCLPTLLLPGRAARGGGRSAGAGSGPETVAMELSRLRALDPALCRRVLRAAAGRFGARLGFEHTEELLALLRHPGGPAARRIELAGGLRAERTLRELRLSSVGERETPLRPPQYDFSIPGEISAPVYGLHLRGELKVEGDGSPAVSATLRAWRPGDRVTLPHSRGPKKITEVLDRLRIFGPERAAWPVIEVIEKEGIQKAGDGSGGRVASRIVWMRGVTVDAPGFRFLARSLPE